jgi:membrane-associated phospholipid phosphatase
MADAAICAWDAKYAFNFWRPVTAIRNGDQDGNADTDPDTTWSSFIATPPFPDYVSGHSTFSGAASTVLALFCRTDTVAFTTGSDFLPGIFRSFPSFSAAAAEAAASRLYGGIHFRAANDDGLQAGIGIGQRAFGEHLKPKENRSRK